METTLAGIILFGSIVPAIATVNACYRGVLKITGSSGMFYSMKNKMVWYFVAWVFYGGLIGSVFGFSSSETESEQKKDSSNNSATNQTQTPTVITNEQVEDSTTEPEITTGKAEPQPYVGTTIPEVEEANNLRYYDFSLAHQEFHHLEIPDFIYFATDGEFFTQGTDVRVDNDSLRVQFTYGQEFSTFIVAYSFYLNDFGFVSDKSTSIYTVTKEVSGYSVSVAAWATIEPECVIVDITLKETQMETSSNQDISNRLEGDGIENQVTQIRNIYNEIMENYANGKYQSASLGDGVTAYYDGFYGDLRYVQVQKGYNQVDYARHYYFHDDELIFLYKESTDSYRLYFFQGELFRNRYTDIYGNSTNYEYDHTDSYLFLEKFALDEAKSLQYLA